VIETVVPATVPDISDDGDSKGDTVTEEDKDPVEVDEPFSIKICSDCC
jgi:hypothetical protein